MKEKIYVFKLELLVEIYSELSRFCSINTINLHARNEHLSEMIKPHDPRSGNDGNASRIKIIMFEFEIHDTDFNMRSFDDDKIFVDRLLWQLKFVELAKRFGILGLAYVCTKLQRNCHSYMTFLLPIVNLHESHFNLNSFPRFVPFLRTLQRYISKGSCKNLKKVFGKPCNVFGLDIKTCIKFQNFLYGFYKTDIC